MKHVWKMLMAALLACMLLVPMGAEAENAVGKANQNGVPAMNTQSATGYTVFTIDKGYEFTIVEPIIENGVTTWYKVYCVKPTTNDTYQVYIAAQYVTFVTDAGEEPKDEVTLKPSVDTELDKEVTAVSAKAKASLNVGMYKTPDTSADMVATIPAGVVVDVTGRYTTVTRTWFRVSYNGKTGFVPSTMLEPIADADDGKEDEKDDDKEEVVIPAIGTLYFALAGIWGFPYGEQIVGTLTAIDTFLGVCLGISSKQYNQQGGKS